MINSTYYHEQTGIYLYQGKLYRILGYCLSPSLTMIEINNIDNSEPHISFGIGGSMNKEFIPLKGIKYNPETGSVEVTKDG